MWYRFVFKALKNIGMSMYMAYYNFKKSWFAESNVTGNKIFVDLPIRPARGCTNQCFHRKWVAVSISAFTTPRRLVNVLNFWKAKADHWWISDQFFCEWGQVYFHVWWLFFLSFLLLLFLCVNSFFLVIYPFSHFLINFLLLCENSLHVKKKCDWSFVWHWSGKCSQ